MDVSMCSLEDGFSQGDSSGTDSSEVSKKASRSSWLACSLSRGSKDKNRT